MGSGLTVEELIRRAKTDDREAFGEVVERFQSRIYAFMLKVSRDPSTAEDLSQEVFLRAWRGLGTFDCDSRFSPWIYRIGMNLASDWGKAMQRVPMPVGAETMDQTPDQGPLPEERADSIRTAEAVEREILALPPAMRQAMLLRHRMGLSYNEIADVMRLPVGTVKTHLFRARTRLKEIFDSMTGEPCVVKK